MRSQQKFAAKIALFGKQLHAALAQGFVASPKDAYAKDLMAVFVELAEIFKIQPTQQNRTVMRRNIQACLARLGPKKQPYVVDQDSYLILYVVDFTLNRLFHHANHLQHFVKKIIETYDLPVTVDQVLQIFNFVKLQLMTFSLVNSNELKEVLADLQRIDEAFALTAMDLNTAIATKLRFEMRFIQLRHLVHHESVKDSVFLQIYLNYFADRYQQLTFNIAKYGIPDFAVHETLQHSQMLGLEVEREEFFGFKNLSVLKKLQRKIIDTLKTLKRQLNLNLQHDEKNDFPAQLTAAQKSLQKKLKLLDVLLFEKHVFERKLQKTQDLLTQASIGQAAAVSALNPNLLAQTMQTLNANLLDLKKLATWFQSVARLVKMRHLTDVAECSLRVDAQIHALTAQLSTLKTQHDLILQTKYASCLAEAKLPISKYVHALQAC